MTPKNKDESRIAVIKREINKELGDADTLKSLIDTTFTGMDASMAKRAMLEGMIRGFSFKDFLEKNVYAIAYGNKYSLVTSIDYSRKIGAKSGIVGEDAPIYKETPDGGIISCAVTVKKMVNGHIGDFTAEVYFSEYSTGYNLWKTKPRTMIAKVAEMHALRKACPEELSQSYVEEEFQREVKEVPLIDTTDYETAIKDSRTLEELEKVWADIPAQAKVSLKDVLEEIKAILITEAKDIQ